MSIRCRASAKRLRSGAVDFFQLLTAIVAVAFVGLLVMGRRDIARGAGAEVASGATLLVLSTLVGVLLLSMLSSYV
jgi:hypothetical protein